jgi:DNA primase small subunit
MTTESNGEETYIRYRAYLDHKEWKKEVTEKCPVKLDIGAVFNAPPSMRHTLKNLHPTQKELVFDIDMTDYDDIRKCCDGAKICSKCWILMTAAVKVIDVALREDFGFENIMFVYSGRRGIHCWVCDERARVLSNDARTAIVEYLTFFQGGSQNAKKVNMGSIHPSAERAFHILDPYFAKYIEEQDLLAFPEMQQVILDLIPQEKDEKGGLRDAIKAEWATSQYGSGYKYKQLRKTLRLGPGEKATKKEKEAYTIALVRFDDLLLIRSLGLDMFNLWFFSDGNRFQFYLPSFGCERVEALESLVEEPILCSPQDWY